MKKKIKVALLGNPNVGKSTIFNALTGQKQSTANYSGVTLEEKRADIKYKDYEISFTDLPGIYSFSTYSQDEVAAKNFIITENPDIIINVIDAANLERNLYLTAQSLELQKPMIAALNMNDVLKSKGYTLDEKRLSVLLGVQVVLTDGVKKTGIEDLKQACINLFEAKENKISKAIVDYGQDINLEIANIEAVMQKINFSAPVTQKWAAIRLLEEDPELKKIAPAELMLRAAVSAKHLEKHFSFNVKVAIAEFRYGFAASVSKSVLTETDGASNITGILDKFALNRYLGIFIFAAVMYLIFKFTFTFSEPLVGVFESCFGALGDAAAAVIPEGHFQSLVVDGIIGGVGGVLGFFPLIIFMFFAISFFEDSGYMARAAFIMDKIMSKFGLSGKSFLPMMITTNGCGVPGLMAARGLDSKRDRIITMLITPFMICGAKLPIFALFIGAFFESKYQTNIMFAMYALSIIIALSAAKVLSLTAFKGEEASFVIELPPYHMPSFKGLLLKTWERGWAYLKKAGGIIVLITIILWAGFTYPQAKNTDGAEVSGKTQLEQSYAGRLGKALEPFVKPIGMEGTSTVALIAGLAAKEVVVSTLGTVYSLEDIDVEDDESTQPLKESLLADPSWSPLKAIVFLIFCLIYVPCVVAIAVFYRESGSSIKWTSLLVFGTTLLAWLVSFIVFQLGTLLKIGV
jgi:ferrous iron transport protein B